jgi:hypothetical protein
MPISKSHWLFVDALLVAAGTYWLITNLVLYIDTGNIEALLKIGLWLLLLQLSGIPLVKFVWKKWKSRGGVGDDSY